MMATLSVAQDTEKKEEADKLFEKEQYVAATQSYLQLISLDPTNVDLNFKYGACLLFNSEKKEKAIPYLNFAVSSPSVDTRAYYFLGKAYHLNYQFEDARKMYQLYLQKTGKRDLRYSVDRDMQMCENGKNLLTTFTDIIVSEKKEIDQEKFFRIYKDMQSIGGQILVTERFQSKLDKKKGYVPIVHFPAQAKSVYYASYGDDEASGLDIYVRRKLPNGDWGDPQRLPGEVNTAYDENFPYLHPSGQYLYFSSKGHNSMGGYDVFMARLNVESNQFERVENVDFAISSPDDDLFYVVDSLYQNAYFASARQSQDGKIHVYRVKVARVPIKEVIIMGDFLSEINPENKTMQISVVNVADGKEVGMIKSNAKGKYSFVFPKGGKYTYVIEVEGSDLTTRVELELPFLDEFRPLKQKIIHKMVNGEEVVQIVNLFDEKVEGGEALIAQVIKRKADLEVNIDQFDPKELAAFELSAKREEILEDLGFKGMSSNEVAMQLESLTEQQEQRNERGANMLNYMEAQAIKNAATIETLMEERAALLEKANATTDPAKKYEFLSEARNLEEQISKRSDEIAAAAILSKETADMTSSNGPSLDQLSTEFNALLKEGKEDEALDLLALNASEVNVARNQSLEVLVSKRVEESIALNKQMDALKNTNLDYERKVQQLNSEIQALDSKLPDAKKKDYEAFTNEIAAKKKEIELYQSEMNLNREDIAALSRKQAQLTAAIDLLEQAQGTTTVVAKSSEAAVKNALNKGKEASSVVATSDTQKQLAVLESNGVKTPENPINKGNETALSDLKKQNSTAEKAILNNSNLSEEARLEALLNNNTSVAKEANKAIQSLEDRLQSDPENAVLLEEQMKLVTYKGELDSKATEYQQQLEQIRGTQSSDAISKEEIVNQIAPKYTETVEAINTNASLSNTEKLEQLQTQDQQLLAKVETRIAVLNGQLDAQPTNNALLVEKRALEELRNDLQETIRTRKATMTSTQEPSMNTQRSSEEVIASVSPNYTEEATAIKNNPTLTELEKATELQALENNVRSKIEKELSVQQKRVQKDPTDEAAKSRVAELERAQQLVENRIEEHTQTINALNQVSSVETPNVVVIEGNLKAEVYTDYEAKLTEINTSEGDPTDKALQKWELEREIADRLDEKKNAIEKEAAKNGTSAQLTAEKEVIEKLVAEQNAKMDAGQQSAYESALASERYTDVVSKVDPGYEAEIEAARSANQSDAVAQREMELQAKLSKEIAKKEKALERKYSVSVELDLMILRNELAESKERQTAAENGNNVVSSAADQKQFVEELRIELLPKDATQITANYTTIAELEKQDEVLAVYAQKLTQKVEALREEQRDNPTNEEIAEQLEWTSSELAAVEEKRRKVRILVGELEQQTVEENAGGSPLEATIKTIEQQLSSEELSSSERKVLEKELVSAKKELLNEQTTALSAELQRERETAEVVSAQIGERNPAIKSEVDAATQSGKTYVDLTSDKAQAAKTPEERRYLLEQARSDQQEIAAILAEIDQAGRIEMLENDQNITISSRAELEAQKRKFSVQIGALERELIANEKAMETAKKGELLNLQANQQRIEDQLQLLTKEIAQIDRRLEKLEERTPLIPQNAVDQTLSFNEERKLAGSDEYKAYVELAREALTIENQMITLEQELEQERSALRNAIQSSENEAEISLKVQRVTQLESKIKALELEMNQKRAVADAQLPRDEERAMKLQNLLARGIQPIKTTVVATALLNMPEAGFAIDSVAPKSVYSAENPIPVDVKSPEGLVYRVQVGAFAKPIPQDLFKEFNPVSGEKIENTNITRYMAGYFNNGDAVVDAREKIRTLGYSDAFVIAYCNGERISFSEARRLEAAGICVPKRANEIMIEVAENTADKLGIPLVTEIVEVPEWSYHDAPGATKATPTEAIKGLFFTVQIAVFNKPVSDEEVKNLPEIMTFRLENGQIRYSTGKFDSVEEALPRRTEALNRGMVGSFVTAYYNGVRITLTEARKLLETNGPSILASNQKEDVKEEIVTPPTVVRTDSVVEKVVELPVKKENSERMRVQVVSKKKYDEYPRDILNRFNTEGNFYYDLTDKRVKSIVYENEDYLPRLYNFRDDIDTLFISEEDYWASLDKKMVRIKQDGSTIPGDLMDWLIRVNYQKEIRRSKEGTEIVIHGIPASGLSDVQNNIRIFGVPFEVMDEIEHEVNQE